MGANLDLIVRPSSIGEQVYYPASSITPTYVVFFETAKTMEPTGTTVAGVGEVMLSAISLGAVFMGAMTYIGNGPNFMVKAIAEKNNIRMPSFFGYMAYSCGVLLPISIIMNLIFLR
ncbi:MAG: sodium:proton antiporter [Planctomycetaceae bacterium]